MTTRYKCGKKAAEQCTNGRTTRACYSFTDLAEVVSIVSAQSHPEVLAVDGALNVLGEIDPRKSQVVELRFFDNHLTRPAIGEEHRSYKMHHFLRLP